MGIKRGKGKEKRGKERQKKDGKVGEHTHGRKHF